MALDHATESRNLKEIVRRLANTERWPGNKIPCDYLVLDTETTGTNTTKDSIVQIGFCLVRNCKPVHEHFDTDYESVTIKLPREKFIGAEGAIAVHGIDYEKSQRNGIPPQDAYKLLYDLVMDAKAKGLYICGHNLYSFDIPFFQTELSRMGINFRFAPNEVVDTAMLVKAMQIGILPGETENAYSYWSRVRDFRAKGVYFNLDRHCMGRFQLTEKYGASKDAAHDAGYDCWLAHLVVVELNRIVTGE
jgi:DNA polymerase III epsilon subunit-like protein